MIRHTLTTLLFSFIVPLSFAVNVSSEEILKEGNLTVRYYRSYKNLATNAVRIFKRARLEINATLGIEFNQPSEILLCRTRKEFISRSGVNPIHGIIGVANSARNLIVIDCSSLNSLSNSTLNITLRHELCHLAIGQLEEGSLLGIPRWFHEGVASWVAGRLYFGNPSQLRMSAANDALIPLDELWDSFPNDRDSLALAYVESESFISFIAKKFGHDSIKAILASYKINGDFDHSFQAALGKSWRDLEKQWQKGLKPRFPLLYFLSRNISLFTLIAFLTIVAFLAIVYRNRQVKRKWEEEERWTWYDEDDR